MWFISAYSGVKFKERNWDRSYFLEYNSDVKSS